MDKRKVLKEYAETIVKVADTVPDDVLEEIDVETLARFIGATAILKEMLEEDS